MKIASNNTNKIGNTIYNVTKEGSLGLLAFGDIGLRAWRKVKQESIKKDSK